MSGTVNENMGSTHPLNNSSTLFLEGRVGALIEIGAGFYPMLRAGKKRDRHSMTLDNKSNKGCKKCKK